MPHRVVSELTRSTARHQKPSDRCRARFFRRYCPSRPLALKPLDDKNQVLSSFAPRLAIPLMPQKTLIALAVALAFDGPWRDVDVRELASTVTLRAGALENLIWQDGSARICLFTIDDVQRADLLTMALGAFTGGA